MKLRSTIALFLYNAMSPIDVTHANDWNYMKNGEEWAKSFNGCAGADVGPWDLSTSTE